MTAVRHFLARLRALARGHEIDRDFADELQMHLDMLTADNIAKGMTPAEARRQAAIRMGAMSSLQSQHRDARGFRPLEEIGQDVRFATRLTMKERWLSAAIIGVLALGIGANTFGFALINAAFWHGLPVDESDRLVMVSWINTDGRRQPASHIELLEWQRATSFESVAGYQETGASLSDAYASPDRIHKTRITTNTFALLRMHPSVGREFIASDAAIGAAPVVILSHELWQRRYGSNPTIVGDTIRIDAMPATVIGIMPKGMLFPDRTDVWVPFVPTAVELARDRRPLEVIARLTRQSDQQQAIAELRTLSQSQLTAHPAETEGLISVRIETIADNAIGGVGRRVIRVIMFATTFVLLIAAANVVILVLLRSSARAGEMALRAAIGATRWRLARQLVIESLLLSLVGAAAGLGVAAVAVRLFALAVGNWLPYWVVFALDYRAFGYAAVIAVIIAVVFGVAPLISLNREHAIEAIHDGGRGTVGVVRVRRLTAALVIVELAVAVTLLGGAGLLTRSVLALYSAQIGVDTRSLVTMAMTLPQSRYATADSRSAFAAQVQSAMSTISGVESATITTGVPSRDGGERLMEIEGADDGAAPVFVSTIAITPTYFDTIGLGLIRGRNFDQLDGGPGSDVAIINHLLAEKFFRGQDPIGRRLRFTLRRFVPGQTPGRWRTIVGIAPDIGHGSPDEYMNSAVYVPYREAPAASVSLMIRTNRAPDAMMRDVQRQMQTLDADLPIDGPQTIDDLLRQDRWTYRLYGIILGSFAAIAVVLSAAALYAVVAYAVARRRAEFGVRAALGAGRRALIWLPLRSGLVQIAIGIAIGLGGAIATGRALEGMLIGVRPGDPITLVAITALLSLIAIAACLIPAMRAARVDPATMLRAE